MEKSKPQIFHKVNTRKVKDKKDEENLVTYNSKIEAIKTPGYFKLFDCGKSSSTTWTQYMNVRARKIKRKRIGGEIMII